MNEFITYLKSNEWNVELYETPLTDEKVNSALSRYQFVSDEYFEFLKTVKRCINKDETVWFTCFEHFEKPFDEEGFNLNEFELISLNSAENDEEYQKVKSFWDKHLPIIISLDGEYSYYAMRNDGKIVCGYEPEFEETTVIANSFEDFIKLKIITSDDVKNDDNFWIFFLFCGFSQGYDEKTDTPISEFLNENYEEYFDMEWSDKFTGYYDGIIDDSDGYVDMPKRLKIDLSTGNKFYIDFHPCDVFYYIDNGYIGSRIGSSGADFKLGILSWEDFQKYTADLSDIEKFLIMPMLNAENADTDYFQTLIKSVLRRTPVHEDDIEVLCEMIINHCKSLCNE